MKKTYTTRNNDKHSMEKPNGLHEAAAVSKKSPRNSYDIEVHPISFHGCSVLWDSDSDLGSKSREKKAYPLPQPSASSCRASMESHQRGSSFGSERVSVSSFTSNESSSSDDDDIHGDFNPNGEIKLADFGMAKHMTSCSSMLSFKGSPYWMAPEVIMNAHGYSLAVDIWSLGCTVLEMATSKPPWSQYEGVAAIFKIANSKGFPDIPNNLSKDAQNFIKLCLQREPTARPTALKLLQHPFVQDQSMVEPTKFNLVDDRRRPSKGSWDEISLASSLPESPCSNSTQQCKSACGSSHRSSYQTSY
ncbi:hypothetical protein GOBAR_DD08653 [Gossypium barbadense]|nr:hypothetical protein GOBAR_DD08653 [Gossypium barbadense]